MQIEIIDRTSGSKHIAYVSYYKSTFNQDTGISLYEDINNIWNTINNIANKLHPVGSIYISQNPTDPSELFGGTWERIYDRMLLCAGDNYSAGSTGGEVNVALNGNQIPSHNHTFTGGSCVTSPAGDHNHYLTGEANTSTNGGEFSSTQSMPSYGYYSGNGGAGVWGPLQNSGGLGQTGTYDIPIPGVDHYHTFNLDQWQLQAKTNGSHIHSFIPSGTVNNSGNGWAHNNMPPYLAVYAWIRIG